MIIIKIFKKKKRDILSNLDVKYSDKFLRWIDYYFSVAGVIIMGDTVYKSPMTNIQGIFRHLTRNSKYDVLYWKFDTKIKKK